MKKINFRCSQKFEQYIKERVFPVRDALSKIIIGQSLAVNTCVAALFAVGQRDFDVINKSRVLGCANVLMSGATGVGKTIICKALSAILGGSNKRISSTADTTASDLTGGEIILLDSSKYVVHGPAWNCNILLIDEINRLSPKASSALIEMLAEAQITIGDVQYRLKNPFLVLATMNPSEAGKGLTKISEALSDRFTYKVIMEQTTTEQKVAIAKSTKNFNPKDIQQILTIDDTNEAREFFFDNTYVDDKVRYYCANILNQINCYKANGIFSDEQNVLENTNIFRQSPPLNDRCLIHLESAAMANAMLNGRDFVVPRDVYDVAHRVIRGRLLLNPSATPSLLDMYPTYSESDLVDYFITKALSVAS